MVLNKHVILVAVDSHNKEGTYNCLTTRDCLDGRFAVGKKGNGISAVACKSPEVATASGRAGGVAWMRWKDMPQVRIWNILRPTQQLLNKGNVEFSHYSELLDRLAN
jgi:hypothetical protein